MFKSLTLRNIMRAICWRELRYSIVRRASVVPPRGEVASYKVQIDVSDNRCVLSYEGPLKGQVATDLVAPCEFLRDPAGNIPYRELQNTKENGGGYYSVIVVIGGPPANEGYSDKYMKTGCGSEVRSVSFSVRGIAL